MEEDGRVARDQPKRTWHTRSRTLHLDVLAAHGLAHGLRGPEQEALPGHLEAATPPCMARRPRRGRPSAARCMHAPHRCMHVLP